MNTYNINDEEFKNTSVYKNYLTENPGIGWLKIRAYAASEAIPIQGVKIIVSGTVGNNNIIFFEGSTNESGVIEKINLPAPELNSDNLESPNKAVYDILATYIPDNITKSYKINMFEGVCVVQDIIINPDMVKDLGVM